MQTPGGSGRCRNKDHIHGGDTHFQVRPDNPIDQMYTMEHLSRSGRGRLVRYQLANSGPRCQIPTPTLGRTTLQKKRKRAVPRFRPSTVPKPTAAQPPAIVSEAPAKPKTDAPENRPPPLENVPVCKSTP